MFSIPLPCCSMLIVFLCLISLSLCVEQSGNDQATISIYSVDGFVNQRACASNCFLAWNGDQIGLKFGCRGSPPQNYCYCREDLQSQAQTHLSTCVKSACSNTVDMNSALSFYNSYCEANAPGKVPSVPSNTPARTTNSPAPGPTVRVTTTVAVTSVVQQISSATSSMPGEYGSSLLYSLVSHLPRCILRDRQRH